jgi:Coenzyme PQQ synthesis protein D (PqqD)
MLTPESTVVACDDQISANLGGDTVVMHPGTEMYFSLDAVGARIWELLQSVTTVAAIRDAIVAEYDVEIDRCERDLLALLADLQSHGLLNEASA